MIVATAGHVDHGKTALVRALTGVETDRLPEEKRRGLSIDLGYAYRQGGDGRTIGFVDVPGHERFIANMLAGLSGIEAALLVVAADDGPMPQTREHLEILSLLGISRGVAAVTKADRVPAARSAAVAAELAALLEQTPLAAAPILTTSTETGQGLAALAAAIEALAPPLQPESAAFRMAVDRSFVLRGVGLVATGTVLAGEVAVGDRMTLSPGGREVRVRGLRAQNRAAAQAAAGLRCALNLTGPGAARALLRRGSWLTAEGRDLATRRLDVRLQAAAGGLRREAAVHCHIGTGSVPGRAVRLEPQAGQIDGWQWAQLLLERPVDAVAGDRFILRDGAARATLAGGVVVTPFGAERGRAKPQRLAWLRAMAAADPQRALGRLLDEVAVPVDLAAFGRARNLGPDVLAAACCAVPDLVRAETGHGPFAVPRRLWHAWRHDVLDQLSRCHRDSPERLGLGGEELRRGLPRPAPAPQLFAARLSALVAAGDLAFRLGIYHLPGHAPRLAAADRPLWQLIEAALHRAGARSPVVHELAATLEADPEPLRQLLIRAARLGLVVRIGRNRFVLPGQLRALAGRLEDWPAAQAGFSAAAYRDRAAIGRNLAIELLEFFDDRGLTRREGATRRVVASVAQVFGA